MTHNQGKERGVALDCFPNRIPFHSMEREAVDQMGRQPNQEELFISLIFLLGIEYLNVALIPLTGDGERLTVREVETLLT
ncbi:hypothetical protein CesoFtcFv8_004377 [Champsocephalus esox]|uniref:Uncharacterized protein n=1 Tax=Champsocephalus esox TaxID=159716 RepID=A0AAN8HCJ5_9TELE|nr:hypothetical protein CesoFtcFv8_004377 [Champsocephalus esox]